MRQANIRLQPRRTSDKKKIGADWRTTNSNLRCKTAHLKRMQALEEPKASSERATVLIADDLAEWRHRIRELLSRSPEWQIIGEASDGQEAVNRATELQPDIILLDVGMPCLNGIEAAKIIRQTSPNSRILFVTQDGDEDLKNEAVRLGAAGYVLKSDAVRELVPSMSTAMA